MPMKSPDEIKKGLECCLGDTHAYHCDECPYADDESEVDDGCGDNGIELLEDALALIQQLEAKAPRWISVKENEKPRLRQDCLCICSYSDTKNHEWDYMMVLRWMGEGDNGYVNRPHFQHEGMNGMIVTHWMPLPEPPEA